jgi:hypothetical protein
VAVRAIDGDHLPVSQARQPSFDVHMIAPDGTGDPALRGLENRPAPHVDYVRATVSADKADKFLGRDSSGHGSLRNRYEERNLGRSL